MQNCTNALQNLAKSGALWQLAFALVPRICLAASLRLLAGILQGHVRVEGLQLRGQGTLQQGMDDLLTVVAKVLQGSCQEAVTKVWHDFLDGRYVRLQRLLAALPCTHLMHFK